MPLPNASKGLAYLCLQATREGQASYAHVHEIIKGLRRRGFEVDLYEPVYAYAAKMPGAFGRMLEFLSVQARLMRTVKNYSAVYIRGHFAAFPTALCCKMLGLPFVVEVNGPYEDLFIAWPWTRRMASLFNTVTRLQYKWASAVITVTPQLRQWVIDETAHKNVKVIPNGANSELFNPAARPPRPLPENFVIFFGALAIWQGIDTLLEAAAHPLWPKDVYLVVVGDGAERNLVEKAAKDNKLVIYLGKVPYQDLAGIVAASIAGVSPQNSGNGRSATGLFPLKVFETLSCGVPVIVSDYPGQADLVRQNGCGLVVKPACPAEVAQAAFYLFDNPDHRRSMGTLGREAIEREHSWDNRAAETAIVIDNVKGLSCNKPTGLAKKND